MRNFSIFPLRQTNRGHELDEYAKHINDEHFCYCVGSANSMRLWEKRIESIFSSVVYVGNENSSEYGLTTIYPDDETLKYRIDKRQARIICTETDYDKYKKQEEFWLGRGAVLNQSFFQAEVFLPIWQVYQNNYLSLDRVEIFLTDRCTLNCEKCIYFIPYLRKRYDTPLQQLKNDADILFSRVDFVRKLKLLGGEVFLYRHLGEYLDYLYQNYGAQIGEVRLGTNGTVLPSGEILEICRRHGTIVDISDYSAALKKQYNLGECVRYFKENGIEVDVKRTGEMWLDIGFPGTAPSKRSDKENQFHFARCAMFCRQFAKGKLYFCCSNYAAVRAGLFPDDENNYFDFYEEPFDKKALLEFELGFSRKGYMTFCEVCFGGSAQNNPHEVAVAKQVPRGLKK